MTQVSSVFTQVVSFNEMLNNHRPPNIQFLIPENFQWSYNFLEEELFEFEEAHEGTEDAPRSLAKTADALIDLIYVAIGRLHTMGFTPEEMQRMFDGVHESNMTKKRGVVTKRSSNPELPDAIKPEGFVPGEVKIQMVIDARGANHVG